MRMIAYKQWKENVYRYKSFPYGIQVLSTHDNKWGDESLTEFAVDVALTYLNVGEEGIYDINADEITFTNEEPRPLEEVAEITEHTFRLDLGDYMLVVDNVEPMLESHPIESDRKVLDVLINQGI